MKRLTLAMACSIFVALHAHAQLPFFNKYSDLEEVTSININKNMLRLIPNGKTLVEELNISDVMKKLDLIQFLYCEDKRTSKKLRKEMARYTSKKEYEELMNMTKSGQQIDIYYKDGGKRKKEFVVYLDQENGVKIITLVGDLTPEDIQALTAQ